MRTWKILTATLLVAAPASAQDPPDLGPAVVAVVDLARVSDESLIGKDLARQLAELQRGLETELSEKRSRVEASQTEFQGMVEAFQAERDSLPEDQARARENDLRNRQQALQDLIQAAQVDADAAQRRLQNEVARLTSQLDSDIRPHINAVAQEMGVDVLLPRSQTVFAKPALDITDLVIARVDSVFNGG